MLSGQIIPMFSISRGLSWNLPDREREWVALLNYPATPANLCIWHKCRNMGTQQITSWQTHISFSVAPTLQTMQWLSLSICFCKHKEKKGVTIKLWSLLTCYCSVTCSTSDCRVTEVPGSFLSPNHVIDVPSVTLSDVRH